MRSSRSLFVISTRTGLISSHNVLDKPCLISQHASVTLRVLSALCVSPVADSASVDPTLWAGTATTAPRPRSCSAPLAADVSPSEKLGLFVSELI